MKRPVTQTTVLIILAVLLSSFSVQASRPLETYTGDHKEFSLDDLADKKHSSPDYKGKVVLVNFWASWCPPCIYEMPELQRLKEHFSDRPFEILAINVGEKKYKVWKFIKLINFDLPVLLDSSSETFNQWGVKTLPTSFLIDSDGKTRYWVRGNPEWETEETRNIIEGMLP